MHDDLDPVLRDAYARANPELHPSSALKARVEADLVARGLLGRRGGGWRRQVAIAAAAATIGFFAGRLAAGPPAASPDGALPGTGIAYAPAPANETPLEAVQRTGSAHARALEQLVDTDRVLDPEVIRAGKDVLLAAERASSGPSAVLLAERTTDADDAAGPGVVWRGLLWF